MNKIFLEYLNKYTSQNFELIIIDNGSTDGSAEFFEKKGVRVLKNKGNYSYPYCQNQGIKQAEYDNLLFLNNDIIVSPDWDKRLLEVVEKQKLELCFVNTNDRLQTPELTRKIANRWKAVRNPLYFLFGQKRFNLLLMHRLMYGNWENFTNKRFQTHKDITFGSFCGSAVFAKRSAFNKIGLWDERIQAADFDIFMRCMERYKKVGDINSPVIVASVYFHHFQRLTLKQKYPPFKDVANLISIKEKWGIDYANELLKGSDVLVS